MKRQYQYDFSKHSQSVFDVESRQRKARTMLAVLENYFQKDLKSLTVLNVGGSAGIIDHYLSEYCQSVTSIDIDKQAIAYAKKNYQADNLSFEVGDAMSLSFDDSSFDIIINSHVYEHVPDADIMMSEIFRVLNKQGACYFAAGNRLMWNEPHYNLPLLSVMPATLAHIYIRLMRKHDFYHEKHFTFWGLKNLVKNFEVTDYTGLIINQADKYHTEYMISPGSLKARIATFVFSYFKCLVPSYVWILTKPRNHLQ